MVFRSETFKNSRTKLASNLSH